MTAAPRPLHAGAAGIAPSIAPSRDSALTIGPFVGTAAEWDAFAEREPGFTHFHRHGWSAVIGRALGHRTPYLAARDATGALRGVLPLVRVSSALFGRYLVSMPFLNYGGPLGTPEAVEALVREAARIARAEKVKLLELRNRVALPEGVTLPEGMVETHRKITVCLDLPEGDPDLLFKRLDAKLRSQVRRPIKEGVTVRFGADQVGPFYQVFAEHMRDLGTPALPRAIFESAAAEFGDSAWFACAYLGDQPVACGAGFRWNDEFEITWASSLVAHKKIAPNMLLYWSFMERAVREGVRTFNFGRCTPGGGTHRFKLQWGGHDEPLYWYDLAREGTDGGTPSPDDAAYSWGPRLWKKLPLPVATLLGPRIVRGIP